MKWGSIDLRNKDVNDTTAKLSTWGIVLCILIAMLGYLAVVAINQESPDNIWNFITYVFSIVLFVYGLWQFLLDGITISNTFLMCFYLFLAVNCFLLSGLQKAKTFLDLYYFFVGPLMFYEIIKATEKKKLIISNGYFKIDYDKLCLYVVALFVLMYIFIFRTKGVRIFSTTLKSQQADLYVIPGISGWIDVLGWLTLMLSYTVKKKLLRVLMYFTPPIFTFLNASRTLTMRMVVFLICLFLYKKGKKVANSKTISRIIVVIISIIIVFGVWGNYREEVSGYTSKSITTLSDGYIDNDIFNWVYSYSALNYDVLKQTIIEESFPMQCKRIFAPIIRIIGGSEAILNLQLERASQVGSISGFNGATFMSNPIYEMNVLYWIQLLFLAIIVSFLGRMSKSVQFYGGYIYFLMASVMATFGNFYIDVNGIYGVVLGIIICFCVSPMYKSEHNITKKEKHRCVLRLR